MKKIIALVISLCVLLVALQVQAQGDDICSPAYLNERVNGFMETFAEAQSTAQDNDEGFANLQQLQDSLAGLQELCANVADEPSGGDSANPGSGTLEDPYAFGVVGDTGEGFSLQVTGYLRPADQIIRNANMFNDRPGDGELYVIVNVAMQCHADTSSRCEANYFDFELVGDLGTIYPYPSVVYDDKLDVSLFAGGQGTGGLPFLIRADDTNLRLLYRSNRYRDEMVVLSVEPSLDNGLQITAMASINVRNGPSTNHSVVGNLAASTPVVAFGRNDDGTWLQIPSGWIFAELVTVDGDVEQLPVTAQ